MASISDFDTAHLRFADINGSGTMDMLYFPLEGGVHVYTNYLGNS
jgi:hypothetical protein